ncbi:hypothetical protein CerSpe_148530 [Prunus speciosa]
MAAQIAPEQDKTESIVDDVSTAVAIVLQQTAWAFPEGKFNKGDAVIMFHCGHAVLGEELNQGLLLRTEQYIIEVPF